MLPIENINIKVQSTRRTSVFKKAIEHNTEAQDYEYVIYCYSSACFNKLGDDEAAKAFLEAAKGVYPEKAEGYIQEILNLVKD